MLDNSAHALVRMNQRLPGIDRDVGRLFVPAHREHAAGLRLGKRLAVLADLFAEFVTVRDAPVVAPLERRWDEVEGLGDDDYEPDA
jgi:hypothetical protein